MQRISAIFFYFTSFGLARGGLFLAPIVLANLLTPADYGVLELAQAIGSMGATVLALGTSAAVPLILVRKIQTASWGAVLLHQLGIAGVLVVVALAGWLYGTPAVVWFGAACAIALMLQALWSVTLKSLGHGEASLLIDAGFWGILALTAALCQFYAIPADARGTWSFTAICGYAAALTIFTIWHFTQKASGGAVRMYGATLRTGLPLMAAALLATLATTSGRLGIGLVSTPEMTAQYAVLFRATALPIVAHQIIIVAHFRKVFELSHVALERQLLLIVAFVTSCVLIFWLCSDFAGLLLGPAFVAVFSQHRAEGLLILTQSILWSAIALNDLTNTRAQSASHVIQATTTYFVLALPMAWWFLTSRPISMALFVPVHSALMGGYFLAQVLAMWSRGIYLWRTWFLAFGNFVILSLLTQVN